MPAFIDLTGHKYGNLTVKTLYAKGKGKTMWECACDCGKTIIVQTGPLRSGNTKSCGCLRINVVVERNTSHGLSDLPEYSVWKDMKKRCYNKNNKRFNTYSEKGIAVDPDFVNDFKAWLEHVGRRPDDGQRWSIGRIDNNLGYIRGNMEWQLDYDQAKAHSLQKNNKTGVCGVSKRTRTIGGVEYTCYKASLKTDGKSYGKEFSADKFGDDEAFKMACEYRQWLLEEYGEDFHPSHGTKPVNR